MPKDPEQQMIVAHSIRFLVEEQAPAYLDMCNNQVDWWKKRLLLVAITCLFDVHVYVTHVLAAKILAGVQADVENAVLTDSHLNAHMSPSGGAHAEMQIVGKLLTQVMATTD